MRSCTAAEYETAQPTQSSNRQCAACPAGHSCDGTATTTPCAAGYAAALGAGSCTQCNAGYASSASSAACTQCNAGHYSAAGASSCAPCVVGTFSASGAQSCTVWRECGVSYGLLSPGSATRDRVCAACLSGSTYSSETSAAPCQPVVTCTASQHEKSAPSASSNRECASCPAGHRCDGSATAVPCTAGQWAAAGVGMCSQCSAGHWSAAQSSKRKQASECTIFHTSGIRNLLRGRKQIRSPAEQAKRACHEQTAHNTDHTQETVQKERNKEKGKAR